MSITVPKALLRMGRRELLARHAALTERGAALTAMRDSADCYGSLRQSVNRRIKYVKTQRAQVQALLDGRSPFPTVKTTGRPDMQTYDVEIHISVQADDEDEVLRFIDREILATIDAVDPEWYAGYSGVKVTQEGATATATGTQEAH